VPAWVRSACEGLTWPGSHPPRHPLVEIEPGPRTAGGTRAQGHCGRGQRLLGAVRPADQVAILDERGTQLSTRELAAWLQERMQQGEIWRS